MSSFSTLIHTLKSPKNLHINTIKKLFVSSCFCLTISHASFAAESLGHLSHTYSNEEIKADLVQWQNWLHKTHPNLTHSITDIDAFYQQIDDIQSQLPETATGLEVWQNIARLNDTMADGHLSLGAARYTQWREWISQGAELFPFEVAINSEGVFITSQLGGRKSGYRKQKITHINHVPANKVIKTLLAVTEGDTLAFRQALLSRRFPLIYRLVYGAQEQFDIGLENTPNNIMVPAQNTQPVSVQNKPFEHYFNLQLHDNQQAVLTVKQFGWGKPEEYFTFMKNAFAKLEKANVKYLLIDISENTGGDDVFWMDGILKYIAKTPYKQGSYYEAKVLAKYRDPGEVVGTVVTGELTRMIQPNDNSEQLFSGKVSVLTGPLTYSSAVLFANTVQDHGFAKLIGMPTGGRSTQSGGIQFLTLKNTGLRAIAPRFILSRPNGNTELTPVQPDISLPINPFAKAHTINQALMKVAQL